jgi:predicted nucleic acid-binding protein
MKTTVLIETDVIVDYLKTGKGSLPSIYEKYTMIISASTFSEVLASQTFTDEGLMKEVMEFIDKYFTVREYDKKTAMKAAELLRKNDNLTLGAAITAATSITEKVKMYTEDRSVYQNIEGVEFLDFQ